MINGLSETVFWVLSEYNKISAIADVPIKVDILREIIRLRSGLNTITWTEVQVNTPNLYGNIKFYYPVPSEIKTLEEPTTAIIRYKNTLNFCWQRFVICKEMCHCLIDTSEDRVSNVTDLKTLIERLAAKMVNSESWPPIQSEQWAEAMALELLYPLELREQHAQALKAGKIVPRNLALRYRIPEEFAEIGMYVDYLAVSRNLRQGKFVI